MRPQVFILLLAALLLSAGHGGASPVPAPVKAAPPPKSTLLRDDPLLQQKITLDATDKPLGDVLKDLSPTLKVDLTVSSQIADQRVTLHLTDQPVYLLLNRLPQLLSHLPAKPHGYYWEKLDRPAGQRPVFNLWRDLRSVQDEERELDYPRREAGVLLRDVRNLSQLTPEQRAKYQGDYPYTGFPGKDDPFGEALRGLSDEQLEALLGGTKIALDPARFARFLAVTKQKQRDGWKHRQELDKMIYGKDLSFPNGFPTQPDVTPVLSVSLEEREGFVPDGKGLYDLSIAGIDYSTVLDVYDTNQSRSPDRNPVIFSSKPLPGPLVDLTPLLTDKSVTPTQRGDLGFTLQALAKVAHLNIYQEDFFKAGATHGYETPGPTPLKGTLPQVIAGICAEWNCHAEKVGGDYLFWSRTWAWDRAVDIPDRLLAPWQVRFRKQGMKLDDLFEIASALTWPQMATLSQVLPEGCPSDLHAYTMSRLLGLLSPAEYDAAWSTEGLPLAGLSPEAQQTLADGFQRDLANVPGDQLGWAALKVKSPPPGMTERMVGVNVQTDGKTLCGAVLATSPPPAAPIPSRP